MDSTVAPEVEVPALLSSAPEGEGGGEDDGKQQQQQQQQQPPQQQEPSKQTSDRISHSHNHVTVGDVQHGIVGLGQGIGHRAQDAAAALRKKAELLGLVGEEDAEDDAADPKQSAMVWYAGDRGKIVASGRGFRVGKGFHRCTSSEGNNVLSRRRPSSSSGESFVEYSFDNIWGAAEAVVSLRYRSNVQENEDPPVPLALGLNGTPVASKQTGNGIGGKIQALCWEVSIKHRRTLC